MMQMAATQVLHQEHNVMQSGIPQQPLAPLSSLMPVIPQVCAVRLQLKCRKDSATQFARE